MRSPLTGIVFTLELTHAWNDLPPLLVASVSAYRCRRCCSSDRC